MDGVPLTTGNFNSMLPALNAGEGGRLRESLVLSDPIWSGTGSPAAGVSSGTVQVTLGNSDNAGAFSAVVPQGYNESRDQFRVRVLAIATTTTTNTLEIDALRITRAGTAAPITPTTPAGAAAKTISAAAPAWYEFDLSGMGLRAGDAVSVTLGCTIAGNNVLVRGIETDFRAGLTANNSDLR